MPENSTKMKAPVHPGTFIKHEVIAPLALNVTEAAQVLGVTRVTLSNFLNGHVSLSPDMAIRLDKAFGVKLHTIMLMQCSYDIAQAQARVGEIAVARFEGKPRAATQPDLLDA